MAEMVWDLFRYLIRIYDFSYRKSLAIMVAIAFFYGCYLLIQRKKRKITGWKIMAGILFSFYISQVIGITLLNRVMEEEPRFDLSIFDVYRIAFEGNHVFMTQLIANIIMFVPFGILLPICIESMNGYLKMITASFAFSLFIETTQLVTHTGVFEIPDLMNNTIGGFLGFFLFRIIRNIYIYFSKKNKKSD